MKKFIAQFTTQEIVPDDKVRRISNDFFLVDAKLAETLKKIKVFSRLMKGKQKEQYLGEMPQLSICCRVQDICLL